MPRIATMWIRDGVLINRMPVNAVAFAAAYCSLRTAGCQSAISFTELVNFAFEKSGISCAEKMTLFNRERGGKLDDIESAANFYNTLASEAAKHCHRFPGSIELLRDLQNAGAENFITSAVEQNVLDSWAIGRNVIQCRRSVRRWRQ